MDEFKRSVADALRYWEPRRVLYNAVLTAVAGSWVVLTWPHFRSVQLMGIPPGDTHPVLMILIVLAFLANVCYSAAYLVDVDTAAAAEPLAVAVTTGGFGLLGLEPAPVDLETLFLQLTGERSERPA